MQIETSLEYRLSNNGIIKLDIEALRRMTMYLQHKDTDEEAGGVLLGRFLKDSKNIVVDKVSVPMMGDKRNRFSFTRSKKMHQRIIDKEWENSKETCNYIGEWHTHPENYPIPSNVDFVNWRQRLQQDMFSSRYLYFVIVGLKEIRIWEGDKRILSINKLKKQK